MSLQLASILLASLGVTLAEGSPGQMSKIKDFCNGTCPSNGSPAYGQSLFPAFALDKDGNIYVMETKFGVAAQLTSYTSTGDVRWSFEQQFPWDDLSYSVQIVNESIFIQALTCSAPGCASYKSHIQKLSMDGTPVWSRDMIGTSTIGSDGTIYSLATPNTAKGPMSYLFAMNDAGDSLWNYTDGVSFLGRFANQLEIEGSVPDGKICMTATVGEIGNVVCVNMKGERVHTEKVTDKVLWGIQYALIGNGGNFYVRRTRDNTFYHNGTNELYPLGSNDKPSSSWSFTFPDDADVNVGPMTRTAGGDIVVLSRPHCQCRPDSLIAVSPDGKMVWNATLPGKGDVSVNLAHPSQLGPFGAANGEVIVSTVNEKLQDNKTFDMNYNAISKDGSLLWKIDMPNITAWSRIAYTVDHAGDFFIIKDGVLSKVAATKSVYV